MLCVPTAANKNGGTAAIQRTTTGPPPYKSAHAFNERAGMRFIRLIQRHRSSSGSDYDSSFDHLHADFHRVTWIGHDWPTADFPPTL